MQRRTVDSDATASVLPPGERVWAGVGRSLGDRDERPCAGYH
jgi:hypothetical protein